MLLYFITCLSFFFFLKSIHPLKSLPPWASEIRLISLLFYEDLSLSSFCSLISQIPSRMCLVNKTFAARKGDMSVSVEDSHDGLSLLDLPDLALECILEKLPPQELCKMAGVCRSLRERCVSDYFWEKHMKQKWGRVIGPAAYRQWLCHIALKCDEDDVTLRKAKEWGFLRFLPFSLWPFSLISLSKVSSNNSSSKQQRSLPAHSVMTWYMALESGSFWFPAQVYNREVILWIPYVLFF